MTVPTLRDVVIPVAAAYALLVGVVVYAVRHPDAGRPHEPRFGWRPRLRLIALTVGGGYGCLLAIVLVFHVWVVGQQGAMASAVRGGGILAIVAAAVFVVASVIEWGRR